MRQNLYALEVTENELRAKYHDSHPQVIQVRDKIEKSREIFDKQGIRRVRPRKWQIRFGKISRRILLPPRDARIAYGSNRWSERGLQRSTEKIA